MARYSDWSKFADLGKRWIAASNVPAGHHRGDILVAQSKELLNDLVRKPRT